MAKRKIIPYNPKLKEFARQLRNDSQRQKFSWLKLKGSRCMDMIFIGKTD
jgi:hypothetical protein